MPSIAMRQFDDGPYDELGAESEVLSSEVLWERDHQEGHAHASATDSWLRVRLWNYAVEGAQIKPAHLAGIRRAASLIAARVELPRGLRDFVIVEGHASRTGPAAYNLQISQRRAGAAVDLLRAQVRAELVRRLGADAARVVAQVDGRIGVRAVGATDPWTDGATPRGLAHNRRVEIRVF